MAAAVAKVLTAAAALLALQLPAATPQYTYELVHNSSGTYVAWPLIILVATWQAT